MKIITTVGTSIFENYKQKNKNAKEVIEIYNGLREKSHDFSTLLSDDDELDEDVKDLKDNTYTWAKKNQNSSASAEIASILAIAGNETDVKVHLIATDTVLSVLAAELIKCWFECEEVKKKYPQIKCVAFERPKEKLETQADSDHIIHKLRVSSNKDYQEGFMNLIEVVSGLIDTSKKAKEEVILNITGGYKAIIPIMTLIGQIKEVSLKYIYEESDLNEKTELVEVGNLPIEFDFSVIDDNYVAFEGINYKKGDKNVSLEDDFKVEISNEYRFEELKDTYKLVKVIKVNGTNRIKETFWGSMLHKTYDLLYNQDRMVRQSLISNLIELKVFEFFAGLEEHKCICGYKINEFDVDIFVETDQSIKAIEVKPSSNIPVWKGKSSRSKEENSIEKNSYEGAFFQAKQKYKTKNVEVELFIYGHNEPHYRAIEQLLDLKKKDDNPCKDLKIIWLHLSPNYKTNTEWKVKNRLKLFEEYDKVTRTIKWKTYS